MMLPGAGSVAYFVMEVLPDLMAGPGGHDARKKAASILNPNRDINAANHDLEVADTVQNNQRLANEFMEKGRFAEASDLYKKCLTGLNKRNPELMYGYAASQFELGNHTVSRTTLDTLIAQNPDYKKQDAHLCMHVLWSSKVI
ncbi:MAG: tetratricopeptide repeat protein [Granulosicoccaceae bacterium]